MWSHTLICDYLSSPSVLCLYRRKSWNRETVFINDNSTFFILMHFDIEVSVLPTVLCVAHNLITKTIHSLFDLSFSMHFNGCAILFKDDKLMTIWPYLGGMQKCTKLWKKLISQIFDSTSKNDNDNGSSIEKYEKKLLKYELYSTPKSIDIVNGTSIFDLSLSFQLDPKNQGQTKNNFWWILEPKSGKIHFWPGSNFWKNWPRNRPKSTPGVL